jgi:hypothetical protein
VKDAPLAYGFAPAAGTYILPITGNHRYLPGTTPGPTGQPSAAEAEGVAVKMAEHMMRDIYSRPTQTTSMAKIMNATVTVIGLATVSRVTWDATGRLTYNTCLFATK